MRPIDADALKADLHMVAGNNKSNKIDVREVIERIDLMRTLDVKPAKYTTWYVDHDLYTDGECKCLSCGAILDDEMIDSNYCPVCGAEVIDPEEEYTRAANETN